MTTVEGSVCPVCGGRDLRSRFGVRATSGIECGISAERFAPAADSYGETLGRVVRCNSCTHSFVEHPPAADEVAAAYAGAEEPGGDDEEAGRLATGHEVLSVVERHVAPGPLLDVGCWTGSFLVAARDRGWQVTGVEPSGWARHRATERGLTIVGSDLGEADVTRGSFRAVCFFDVLEHLHDPGAALDRAAALLDDEGILVATVPDAGSVVARVLGSRWWSVLPMHLQYFTRASMRRLLRDHGFHVVHLGTHPKRFTADYYADRLSGYSPAIGRALRAAVRVLGWSDRLIGPDFRDRMLVIARR